MQFQLNLFNILLYKESTSTAIVLRSTGLKVIKELLSTVLAAILAAIHVYMTMQTVNV